MLILFMILSSGVAYADPLDIYCASYGSRDGCLLSIAQDRNDPSYCADIDGLSTRNTCYSYMAEYFEDRKYCQKVKKNDGTYEDMYECFEDFLEEPEDISICNDYIKSGEYHDECIKDMMKMTEDAGMCLLMDMMDSRLECYLEFAEDQADEELCSLMLDNIDVGECRHDDIEICDSEKKLEEQARLCRNKVKAASLVHECKSYNKNIETSFEESEKSEFIFQGDDPHRGTFTIEVKAIDLLNGYANVELKANQNRARYNLFIGQTIIHEFFKIMVLDIYDKNEGETDEDDDPMDPEPVVKFCFFKENDAPEIEPEEEEEPEPLMNESEDEEEKEEAEPEAVLANESDYKVIDTDKKSEENKGLLRKVLIWFWGLFGFGS